jgi:glutamyl-Q tRNA(Asp) synthetase
VENAAIAFDDVLQGKTEQHLGRDVGDFVVRRADGCFAYQLAVVVDDCEQGITHVVRGADLLASTPRQILLQRLLAFPTPQYSHLPVAVNRGGEKLSKQTLAAPVTERDAPGELARALRFLGQSTPAGLAEARIPEIWAWARKNWRAEDIPRQGSLPADEVR